VKKLILAGLMFAAIDAGCVTWAADLPVEAPIYRPPPPVAYNWTGIYLGGNVGGHFGRDDISTTAGTTSIDVLSPASLNPRGAAAGLQIGYNWQSGIVVVGLELDGSWLDGTASRTLSNFGPPLNPADTLTNSTNAVFLATVRPRIGVAFDRFLLYATGGLAFSTIKLNENFTTAAGAVLSSNISTTRTGETIGAGIEYAFLDSWTAKFEYLYVSFASYDNVVNRPVGSITVHHRYSDNIARVGLNYRFFGPVYWKY
jgi:outer membrane immunogenic protein